MDGRCLLHHGEAIVRPGPAPAKNCRRVGRAGRLGGCTNFGWLTVICMAVLVMTVLVIAIIG
jgi:hypothetical protein